MWSIPTHLRVKGLIPAPLHQLDLKRQGCGDPLMEETKEGEKQHERMMEEKAAGGWTEGADLVRYEERAPEEGGGKEVRGGSCVPASPAGWGPAGPSGGPVIGLGLCT